MYMAPGAAGTVRYAGGAGAARNAAAMKIPWPGFDAPGFMAEYMLVPSPRHLVPLLDLDPVRNVPLTDAGLTPYHAIKPTLTKLVPGSTAVVIGAGGLGHLAIQILRASPPGSDRRRSQARARAHAGRRSRRALDANAADTIRARPGCRRDPCSTWCADATLALGAVAATRGPAGDHRSHSVLPINFFVPPRAEVATSYRGRSPIDRAGRARAGAVRLAVEQFPLEAASGAYHRLRRGEIRGRAVLVPRPASCARTASLVV